MNGWFGSLVFVDVLLLAGVCFIEANDMRLVMKRFCRKLDDKNEIPRDLLRLRRILGILSESSVTG
jgi:hypothetical protein